MMLLQTHLSKNQELVVTFFGHMDAHGIKSIQSRFEHLEGNLVSKTILDLQHVDFIDASGIGAIVFLYKRIRNRGQSLVLVGVHGQPKILIKMLRIDHSMSVTWSTEDGTPLDLVQKVQS